MAHPPTPPGPKPHWLLGNLPEFRRDPLAFLTHCARTYGDVALFKIFRVPVYLLTRPEHIELVLSTRARCFIKGRSMRAAAPLLGNGLFLAEGPPWIRLRQLNQPAFRGDRIAAFAQNTIDCTLHLVSRWSHGDVIDIHQAMNELTMRIVAHAMLGIEVESEAAAIGSAFHTMLQHFRAQLDSGLLVPTYVPTPANLRMRRAQRQLNDAVADLIERRRNSPARSTDLLSTLVHPTSGTPPLNDRELRDEVITILAAGHETTAAALTWLWYLLSQHADADARIAAEIDQTLGPRTVTSADRAKLPFVQNAFLEAMRLYPPAWTTPRTALEDVPIGDFVLPKGSSVTLSQWVMHRDPRLFPDPLSFQPDRWSDGLLHRLPAFAYFPFGGGPRGCIGESFAMAEALLIIAVIAQRFRLRRIDPEPVLPWPTLTLQPKGPVRMKVELRQNHPERSV